MRTENMRKEHAGVLFMYYFNFVQGIKTKKLFIFSVKRWMSRDRNNIFMQRLSEDPGKHWVSPIRCKQLAMNHSMPSAKNGKMLLKFF